MSVNPTYTPEGLALVKSPNVPYDIEQYVFWLRFLRQRYESTLKRGYPEGWTDRQKRTYDSAMFLRGFTLAFKTIEYGAVVTAGEIGGATGLDYLNMPTGAMPIGVNITDFVDELGSPYSLIIDKNCKIIRCLPDVGYGGYGDCIGQGCGTMYNLYYSTQGPSQICDYYAKKLALAWQAFDVNLLNSQVANVFACDDNNIAESFKSLVSQIYAGNGSVFAAKKLYDNKGNLKVQQFDSDVQKHFIADKLMGVIDQIICEFDSMVGIENTNTKVGNQGGISDMQIMSNNQETESMHSMWIRIESETQREAIRFLPELEGLSVESAVNRKEDDDYANVERND